MAVSILVQLFASALVTTAAAADDPAASVPAAPACGSPIYDAKHDCRVIATGSAKLQCLVMADGSLQSCKVVEETPPGKGFGEAAMGVASHQKVKADSKRPETGVWATIPFNFKAEE
jgi:hypothetical protein